MSITKSTTSFVIFKLQIRKKHIISNSLSYFTSANTLFIDPKDSKLDSSFVHSIMLVKIHPTLMSEILVDYMVAILNLD